MMENGQACSCFNGTQDDEGNFSAPVPVIGLYIAGATLVCLSLIVGDLVNAFRRRMFWVPCRFFTLNSFTLTVVGVVTKIPVDLTTSMPGGQDQLAKLYGTGLLFIFMVLFLPSIGYMSASERIPNLASLTLVVITVIVNICMQIGTGLIFKFVVEHVMIMVLMLLTLSIMWSSNTDADTSLDAMIDGTKDAIKICRSRDGPGLDKDMKLFLLGKWNTPELVSCKYAHYPTMGILCATCFIVSSEATFRAALHQKISLFFGQSVSDYKWSMWVLVGTQILTILVGSVSIGLKSLFLARRMKPFVLTDKYNDFRSYQLTRSFMPLFRSYFLPKSLSGFCIPKISQWLRGGVSFLQFIINIGMEWTDQVLIFLVNVLKYRNDLEESERIFRERFPNAPPQAFSVKDESFNKWLMMQSCENTELLIKKERLRNPRSSPLIQLLSSYPAGPCTSSTQQLDSMQIGTNEFIVFILLVNATDALPPSDRTRSLVSTFDEVFDILYFIGENSVTKDYVHEYTMWIGRDYWMRMKASKHCFQRCLTRWRKKLNYERGGIRRILETQGTISVFNQRTSLVDLINIQENEPLELIYRRIEEQFICLLHRFLNRLPGVIFKYIVESSYQDFSERATMCLKFLCRLNLIDAKVQWSETNIISFITREATGVPEQVIDVSPGRDIAHYSSEIVHRIAAGIVALFNASRLTIGIPGEEQGNQTIISSEDNSGIIARIVAFIDCLITASPPTTEVTSDEQGSQTFITMETLIDDYNQNIAFHAAACLAGLILGSRLAIALCGEEQGSQAFITRETCTDDNLKKIALRIVIGIAAIITASPPTVGVAGEEQGSESRAFITSEIITDDDRRGIDTARVADCIANSLILAVPSTIEPPDDEGQGSQTFGRRETLTPEKVLHVLFIKLLSNSCSISSRVGDEQANDIRRHVFQQMQEYSFTT